MTVKEIMQKDNDDEDLNKYKKQLLGNLDEENFKEGERKIYFLSLFFFVPSCIRRNQESGDYLSAEAVRKSRHRFLR